MLTTAAVAAVLAAVILVFGLIELSTNGTVQTQLGDHTFIAGRATDLAVEIGRRGPVLLPDLLGRARPVYLQHLGPDPMLGWVGVQALATGADTRCVLSWSASKFHDPCTSASYPADGTGLTRYPASVLPSRRVQLDLRSELAPDATVTTGTVPTTVLNTGP